ncbi:MAG: hypothetical protein K6G42_06430 [Lachnospiraceae bacterium]|nr:hypothetical protein [Lachnospiraceae bacterium]
MTISEFEKKLEEILSELFGNCTLRHDILRSVIEHLGVTDSSAIFEAAIEPGLHPEAPRTIVHFHSTLAQSISEEQVPYVILALNDLNNVISVGAFPAFGCFAYYPPLQQVYLTYRLPVDPEAGEAELDNIRYYLGALYEQLDIFTDFILFSCDHPGVMDLEAYMEYLDMVSNLNDLNERIEVLREQAEELLDPDTDKKTARKNTASSGKKKTTSPENEDPTE